MLPRNTGRSRPDLVGYRRCVIGLPVIRPVPPGLPRWRARGCGRALKCARDLASRHRFICLLGAAFFEVVCGRFDAVKRQSRKCQRDRKTRVAILEEFGGLLRGCVFVATDRGDQATPLIGSGLSVLATTRVTIFSPFGLTWLARAHAACGRVAEAQYALSDALNVVSKTNERWDEAEIHRTAGELAASRPHADPEITESHFQQSLAIARRQEAKSHELRAAINLARLWCAQGGRDEARELLAPIFGWFTEGFDMPDLIEAQSATGGVVVILDRCLAGGSKRAILYGRILFNLSGHGNFDMQAYADYFAGKLEDRDLDQTALDAAFAELPRAA